MISRLKVKAKKENRSLNNYVETVLMDIAYSEQNDETIAAIEEARSGKVFPAKKQIGMPIIRFRPLSQGFFATQMAFIYLCSWQQYDH
ncbi:MAG: hypothetical protein IJJ72_10130 [Bacteroidales bacterium]|nr:hypothetical protein [Bacteroidales bacterium]